MKLQGKNIILGITGGIAAYKSAILVRLLVTAGANVHVIMTSNSLNFMTPLTFQILSGNEVLTDEKEFNSSSVEHIKLAQSADAFIIAPCTANTIAKLAHGIADNVLTTVALAFTKPLFIAPSMNENMLQKRITQENILKLEECGFIVLSPNSGFQACGTYGNGRMMEPSDIAELIGFHIAKDNKLQGKNILITAGPTVENIDPVRYISNYSSGKMGYSLAIIASMHGANVTLISGPTQLQPPANVNFTEVKSADDMFTAVTEKIRGCDVFIGCAAVADFKPKHTMPLKIKKNGTVIQPIELIENKDILHYVGHCNDRPSVVIGFAAETNNIDEYANRKLLTKNADFIVANDVSNQQIGFNSDKNAVTIYSKDKEKFSISINDKHEISNQIINYCLNLEKI